MARPEDRASLVGWSIYGSDRSHPGNIVRETRNGKATAWSCDALGQRICLNDSTHQMAPSYKFSDRQGEQDKCRYILPPTSWTKFASERI